MNPGEFWGLVPTVLGWLFFIASVLYQRSDAVYLWVQRGWAALANPDTRWDLTVDFDLNGAGIEPKDLKKLGMSIGRSLSTDYRCDWLSKNGCFITAGYLRLEMELDHGCYPPEEEPPEGTQLLSLRFLQLPVSYRRSMRLIDEVIGPLVERVVEGTMRPIGKHYYLTIYFESGNPFFGLYVRRLGARGLTSFDIRFNAGGGRVQVMKDSLSLAADSFAELRQLVGRYFVLSPGLQPG